MGRDPDEERIRRKAHELWEADGRHHGRDADHWIQAKEIIAIEDSQASTLLPRDTGAEEPIEDADEALRNLADFPNLTDQGENLLTSVDREPSFAGDGTIPAVEVPTSDQPGIPPKPKRASSKPDPDMKASQKRDTAPASSKTAAAKAGVAPKASESASKSKPATPGSSTSAKPGKPTGSGAKRS